MNDAKMTRLGVVDVGRDGVRYINGGRPRLELWRREPDGVIIGAVPGARAGLELAVGTARKLMAKMEEQRPIV